MSRIRKILRSKKGEGFPLTIAIVLVLIILFTGISEYLRLMIVAQGVRDALQDAVIATVTQNYDEVYHGIREGYSGGYQPVADDFEESLDYGNIYGRLADTLGLEYTGTYEKRTNNNELEFTVYDLEVEVRNAPLATSDDSDQRFEIDSLLTLEVPVSFGGTLLPSMKIQLKTTSGYIPKF
ncbi:hypothetical protein [Chakrabartyella piscis]|uniref:hypothetical protein n=1 Tax=Chakrabartyella piscis TaxID=2918914 RepID=UPI002958C451|nr:hypothetical protein [Chakrabartyella piscis]